MLKNAPIVILDEATANVDPENEDRLQRAIEALTRNKTIIMIAHRLKTVRHADQILVIDHGRIVQQGRHEQLIAEPRAYLKNSPRLHYGLFRRFGVEKNLLVLSSLPFSDTPKESGNLVKITGFLPFYDGSASGFSVRRVPRFFSFAPQSSRRTGSGIRRRGSRCIRTRYVPGLHSETALWRALPAAWPRDRRTY